ncbi:acylphosphatase [Methanocalculus sp.]|uniref:acylphosphatase n=1 Tax=Methanocalculus sp. TaxID=2004547 RepID=UPI00271EA09C|nr:acylphosphatase [Methanocalculus sp.]MDO8841914.1 acylphosphatase [Methanocalculus sp.]
MKRIHVIVDGYVQKVGFREHVRKEIFGTGITGYVRNLDAGEVEIVAEGREDLLQALIHGIDIVRYPIEVTSCNVTWQEATGEFPRFTIIRGDIQEELFERIDYAGTIMHETLEVSKSTRDLQYQTLDKQDQMLHKQDQVIDKQDKIIDKQDQMLDRQDQMIEIGKETRDEITSLRKDTRLYLNDEKNEIIREIASIKDALIRAGIQV